MSGPGIGATQHTPHAQHTPHRPFDDRLTITTPEGVELEIALAGLGSRFTARLLDNLIRAVMVFVFLVTVGLLFAPCIVRVDPNSNKVLGGLFP